MSLRRMLKAVQRDRIIPQHTTMSMNWSYNGPTMSLVDYLRTTLEAESLIFAAGLGLTKFKASLMAD